MNKLLLCVLAAATLIVAANVRAQKCNDQITNEVPTSRYQLSADGTALDLQTGLVWMRCAMGQTWDSGAKKCTGQATAYTWEDALQAVESLDNGKGFAGQHDWRLPNLREITSIESFHCRNPAINLEVFPDTPSAVFWSSSPLEGYGGVVWALDLSTSHVTQLDVDEQHAIRLVRAGAYPNKIPPPSTAPVPGSSTASAHTVK